MHYKQPNIIIFTQNTFASAMLELYNKVNDDFLGTESRNSFCLTIISKKHVFNSTRALILVNVTQVSTSITQVSTSITQVSTSITELSTSITELSTSITQVSTSITQLSMSITQLSTSNNLSY